MWYGRDEFGMLGTSKVLDDVGAVCAAEVFKILDGSRVVSVSSGGV